MTGRAQSAVQPVTADILIEAGDWPNEHRLQSLVDRALAAAIARLSPPLVAGAEVSIVFTDDVHMRDLNRRHRGKDSSTNVLSFPQPRAANGEFGPILGDIVLAAETVAGEAKATGLATEAHLTHLTVHGFLHLIGYDHETDGEADVMEGHETAILAGLGIADPYAERDSVA